MNTGDRIKKRRIELGLTADELAEKIGKSRATIYRYENGDIENMPTSILEPLAKVLKTTPADLMGWEEIDARFSGREASDKTYSKIAQNIEQHHGIIKEIVNVCEQLSNENRRKTLQYSKGLLSIQQMDSALQLNAAHARTDIDIPKGTDTSDDDIMDDENF